MKAIALALWLCAALGIGATASAASSCEFNIHGTWEAVSPDGSGVNTARYRFAPDGTVATLTRTGPADNPQWKEPSPTDFMQYRLDDAKAPATIDLLSKDGSKLQAVLEIMQYYRDTFTTVDHDNESLIRWIKVEPEKYFIVFAARRGPPISGGPAFAMLIRTDRGIAHSEAFGFYFADKEQIVGRLPEKLASKLATDLQSGAGTDAMLRIEISQAEYERTSRVLRTWERRERERAMLYPVAHLNNMVFLNEVAKALNVCSDRVKQYNLTWKADDKVVDDNRELPNMAFRYIKELRDLNGSIHVTDEQFRKRTGIRCGAGCAQAGAVVSAERVSGAG
jgi:hypothetical protein